MKKTELGCLESLEEGPQGSRLPFQFLGVTYAAETWCPLPALSQPPVSMQQETRPGGTSHQGILESKVSVSSFSHWGYWTLQSLNSENLSCNL